MKTLGSYNDLEPYIKVKILGKSEFVKDKIGMGFEMFLEFDEDIKLLFNLNKSSLEKLYLAPYLDEHKPKQYVCTTIIKSKYKIRAQNILEKFWFLECCDMVAGLLQVNTVVVADNITATAIEGDKIFSGSVHTSDIKCKVLYCNLIKGADMQVTEKAFITDMVHCNTNTSIKNLTMPCNNLREVQEQTRQTMGFKSLNEILGVIRK